MANECLVTKLKSVVDNPYLLKMDEFVITTLGEAPSGTTYRRSISTPDGRIHTKRLLTPGYEFVDANGNSLGTETGQQDAYLIAPRDVKVAIGAKDTLEVMYVGGFAIETNDIKYISNLRILSYGVEYVSYPTDNAGLDFSELIKCTSLTDVVYGGYREGMQGQNFEILGNLPNMIYMYLFTNNSVEGDFLEFVKVAVAAGRLSGSVACSLYNETYNNNTSIQEKLYFNGERLHGSDMSNMNISWSTSEGTTTATFSWDGGSRIASFS